MILILILTNIEYGCSNTIFCWVVPVGFGAQQIPLGLFRDVCIRAVGDPSFRTGSHHCLVSRGLWVNDTVVTDFGNHLQKWNPNVVSIGCCLAFQEPIRLHMFHCVDFSKPLVLFPLVEDHHWTVLRVCMNLEYDFRVTLFDGYGQVPRAFMRIESTLRGYFELCATDARSRRASRTKWDAAQWQSCRDKARFRPSHAAIPLQEDAVTCGYRAMHYMEWLILCRESWSLESFCHDNDPKYWELYRLWVLYSLFLARNEV